MLPKALIVSHSGERCGIYQYGYNLYQNLIKSSQISWIYAEINDAESLNYLLNDSKPEFILFNYYPATLPWVTRDVLASLSVPTASILHESDQAIVDTLTNDLFDYWFCPNPAIIPRNPRVRRVPRFIPQHTPIAKADPPVFTVGSFGFATRTKGFERLCRLVNEQFEEALIRLNLPEHDNPRILGMTPQEMEGLCRAEIKKPGIRLEVTHHFFDETQLIDFLAANTINAFLYSDPNALGISSCVDFALAAGRPIALTRSPMFQHLADVNPSLFVEDSSLQAIAANGVERLKTIRDDWSGEKAAVAWNATALSVINSEASAKATPDGRGFNKILDDRSRSAYKDAIARMCALAPEMLARKIERANIQQGFAFDTALRTLAKIDNPKILAAGSFEDTAVEALRKLGFAIDEIDPNVNGMTLLDYYLAEGGKLGTYDIVLSVSVLEHVAEDAQFLKMISEFLKPGGVAILTVDFREGWRAGEDKPIVDHRLYTTDYIIGTLIPSIGNCVLADIPTWDQGVEDFEYEGCQYGFAGLVLNKLDTGTVQQAEVRPVWMDLAANKIEGRDAAPDLMTKIEAPGPGRFFRRFMRR